LNTDLVISAVGSDRPGIVEQLAEAITATGCNIEQSRMAQLAGEFAIILRVTGTPEAIACLAEVTDEIEEATGLSLLTRASEAAPAREALPCRVEVVAMDQPGIVHEVTAFFARRGINIAELATDTYAAPHTGTPMFSLAMTVQLPAGTAPGRLRQAFQAFCDEQGIDGTLEAVR